MASHGIPSSFLFKGGTTTRLVCQFWAVVRCGNEKKMMEKNLGKRQKKEREKKIKRKGREKMESMRCLSKNQIVHMLNIKSDLCVVRSFEEEFLKRS